MSPLSRHNPQLEVSAPDPLNNGTPAFELAAFARDISGMSITAAEAIVSALGDDHEHRTQAIALLKGRKDLLKHFAQLVDNPGELMDLLRCTKTIHTGSRVADYFVPGSACEASDWDFYCVDALVPVLRFHLANMGVDWAARSPSGEEDPVLRSVHDYSLMRLNVARGFTTRQGRSCEVQLILANWMSSPIDLVFQFHTSAAQNVMAGFGAMCLYSSYTSVKETMHWAANDTNTSWTLLRRAFITRHHYLIADAHTLDAKVAILEPNTNVEHTKIIRKYQDRGYTIAPYGSQGGHAHGSPPRIGEYDMYFRHMGDSGVQAISFAPYLKTQDWEIPFDAYWRAMQCVTWYESPYGTAASQSPLLLLEAPYNRVATVPGDQGWSGANQLFDPMANQFVRAFVVDKACQRSVFGQIDVNIQLSVLVYATRLPF